MSDVPPMRSGRPPVVMVTSNYWQGIEYQRHHLARQFAAHGHPVCFIERSPQRWPRVGLADVRGWLFGGGSGAEPKPVPDGISVVTPRWLPPARFLRPLNSRLVRRTARCLPQEPRPILITYVPTFNTLDLIAELDPRLIAYVCVHNYDEDEVMPDLLRAERQLAESCDLLYADSHFLQDRLKRLSGGEQVFPCLPGVDLAAFEAAFRGDELGRRRTLCYFGGLGPHLDLDLYAGLARNGIRVVFIGVLSPALKDAVPPEIEVRPPVPNAELPAALKDADMLMIAYKRSPYIRAVLPAKLFECLGTAKPLLVSGWPEAEPYADCVYDVGGSADRALALIAELPALHTAARQERQRDIAAEADWPNRFAQFYRRIRERLEPTDADDD